MKRSMFRVSAVLVGAVLVLLQGCMTPMVLNRARSTTVTLMVKTTSDHFYLAVGGGVRVEGSRVSNKKLIPGSSITEEAPNHMSGAQGVNAAKSREVQSFTWTLNLVHAPESNYFELYYGKGHIGTFTVEVVYPGAEGESVVKKFSAAEGAEQSEGRWRIPIEQAE